MKQAIKILALPCMGMALLFSASAMSAPRRLRPKRCRPRRMNRCACRLSGRAPAQTGVLPRRRTVLRHLGQRQSGGDHQQTDGGDPAGSAKHYEVRVAVVAVPDAPPAP